MEKKPDYSSTILRLNDEANHWMNQCLDKCAKLDKALSQNERLLSALKEFVHVRYIDQELIDRAKQLINEIEKQ